MIKDAIIIVGCPRSGTTFLKELLTFHSKVWHLSSESHHIFEGPLHPENFSSFSNRPDENFKLSNQQIKELHLKFYKDAINLSLVPYAKKILDKTRKNRSLRKFSINAVGKISRLYKEQEICFLEKTPKNAVRIKYIQDIFPNAKYIFLERDPVDNIYSIIKGWETKTDFLYKLFKGKPRFASAGYQIDELKSLGIPDGNWRFVLPPGWQDKKFRDVLDLAIYQYSESNRLANEDLIKYVKSNNIIRLTYDDLKANKKKSIIQILEFCNLSIAEYDFDMLHNMPLINTSKAKIKIDKVEILHRYKGNSII